MAPAERPTEAEREFCRADTALAADDTLAALSLLERALKLEERPGRLSDFGYCLARERGQHRKGAELCRQSMQAEPDEPRHHLNLGRVLLLAGDKPGALEQLRQGMAKGGDAAMADLLERLGSRKPPLFPSLSRSNPLNRYLGLLLARLGLR